VKKMMYGYDRTFFLGRISNEKLLKLYSCSDIFTFPSTTDTFGMVVLESLACGLPALVSDIGGPKEIVQDRVNGYVLPATGIGAWVEKILCLIEMIQGKDPAYAALCQRAREHVMEHYSWDEALNDILGTTGAALENTCHPVIKSGRIDAVPLNTDDGPRKEESALA